MTQIHALNFYICLVKFSTFNFLNNDLEVVFPTQTEHASSMVFIIIKMSARHFDKLNNLMVRNQSLWNCKIKQINK